MGISPTKLTAREYILITKFAPLVCVDAIVIYQGRVLLCKRSIKPALGKWALPGGRLLKGERLIRGVSRKVMEEVGLRFTRIKFLRIDEVFYPEYHAVTHVYTGYGQGAINIDRSQFSDYCLCSIIPENCEKHVVRSLLSYGTSL